MKSYTIMAGVSVLEDAVHKANQARKETSKKTVPGCLHLPEMVLKAEGNAQVWSFVGLFCEFVGLFCVYSRPFYSACVCCGCVRVYAGLCWPMLAFVSSWVSFVSSCVFFVSTLGPFIVRVYAADVCVCMLAYAGLCWPIRGSL